MDKKRLQMTIPAYIQTALDTLEAAGFEACLVGGCVRDALMGIEPEDYDITTSALPEEIKALFEPHYKIIENGIKHGTVTPVIDQKPVEITTYRIDGTYSDNRHPDAVHFSKNLADDLSRRDFTVNAMAYSRTKGLADYFDALGDLEHRVIRCVGEADKRFAEDALRIIRALRFAAVLEFNIESKTAQSIRENIQTICNISVERIYTELKKLLAGKAAGRVLSAFPCLLQTLFEIVPEKKKLKGLAASPSPAFSLALLFAGEDVSRLKSLKPDNKTYSYVQIMNALLQKPDAAADSPAAMALFIYENGVEESMFSDYLRLRSILSEDVALEKQQALFARVKNEKLPLKRGDLAIDGNALQILGFRGREIKRVQDRLVRACIAGEVKNEPEQLLAVLQHG